MFLLCAYTAPSTMGHLGPVGTPTVPNSDKLRGRGIWLPCAALPCVQCLKPLEIKLFAMQTTRAAGAHLLSGLAP